MVSAISNATATQPVAQSPKTSAQAPAQPATQSGGSPDTVQLSKAAQAVAANLKEATETSAQTAQEAGHGDLQAQRLLAKEVATESASK